MSELFLHLVNISATAGWLIGAVVLLRLVLRKAPRWIFCLLWAMVGLRLLLPFSIESRISLVPSAEPLPESSIQSTAPVINSGIPAVDEAVNPVFSESLAPNPGDSVNPLQVWLAVGTAVWVIGLSAMILYSFFSWLRVHRKVHPRLRMRENIFLCDHIDTPFILGILRPGIYIPSGLPSEHLEPIIAHEKAHLKRLDHLWKPLGFLLLAVYWFNPLVWLAYVLLCRDIEAACDEKVIRDMAQDGRAAYSQALLCCGTGRRMILACPLAFGEVGVKERIKAVLGYKKPAFWILVAALTLSLLTCACFLTNPVTPTRLQNKIQRATDAREHFIRSTCDSFNDFWDETMPDYLLGCRIGEDFKLYIRLAENGREKEADIRAAMEDYEDIVIIEYSDLSRANIQDYVQNVTDTLNGQGFDILTVSFSQRSGTLIITPKPQEDAAALARAVESSAKYSYGVIVNTYISNNDYTGRDYDNPEFRKSVRISERHMAYFYKKGYVADYPEYYAGSYIDKDNLYHAVINRSVENAEEDMRTSLGTYADEVVYEYANYSYNDVRSLRYDLGDCLSNMKILLVSSSQSERTGTIELGVMLEDIHLVEALLKRHYPYPLGSTDIPIEITEGRMLILE